MTNGSNAAKWQVLKLSVNEVDSVLYIVPARADYCDSEETIDVKCIGNDGP